MTVAGGRIVSSFSVPERARVRAQLVATRDTVPTWVHRTGPQAERFIAGGPDPGSGYERFDPATNPAGSATT